MRLIKDGRTVEDRFTRIVDDVPIPDGEAVLVPAARFLADAADFAQRNAPVGVAWPNDRRIAELAPLLDRVAMVALNFPTFRDGRAASQARLLREKFHYRGELRATGDVLRDQFLMLVRVGFDAFEVKKDKDAESFVDELSRYSVFYQPTADGRIIAAQRRRSAPLAASPVLERAKGR